MLRVCSREHPVVEAVQNVALQAWGQAAARVSPRLEAAAGERARLAKWVVAAARVARGLWTSTTVVVSQPASSKEGSPLLKPAMARRRKRETPR